ncbi:MAG: dCTP deaminase [Candidatus Micrarchaeia archaeon]
MLLSNEDIKKLVKEGKIIFSPPISEDQIGQASVDLTLSNEFWIFRKGIRRVIDVKKVRHEDISEKIIADEITLASGQMVLGKTVERIKLPLDIAGRLEGRSTYARMGVAVHITSGAIQPGSDNRQVLEIVNLSPYSIKLCKGLRLCQVFFEKLESATTKPYAKFGRIAIGQ